MKWAGGIAAGVLTLALAASAQAQDFQKSYRIAAGGGISLSTVSGDVRVVGSGGDSIVVHGYREGRDRDLVTIEDNSTGERVSLRVRYPENCNCNASVRFEVQVPRSTSYVFDGLSSVSGDVEVTGVTGSVRAKTVSGNVRVQNIAGSATVKTVSGSVEVEITRLEGTGDMKFEAVSGSVNVRLPANLDADIEISTVSGSLRTDFPIQVEEARYGPGRKARGRIGSGARSLRMSTVSGRVSLSRI